MLTLLLLEGAVRILGFKPATNDDSISTLYMSDALLGWTSKPGMHKLMGKDGVVRTETILEPGLRASSSKAELDYKDNVLLYGCSVTFGFGLNDFETLAWKLQENFPEFRIMNLAVPGFGTLQSVLDFEKRVKEGLRAKLVLYVFPAFHEPRNVGQSAYLRASAKNSSKGNVNAPRCTLNALDRSCQRIPTESYYAELPFRHNFALVHLVEDVYVALRDRDREQHSREITQSLLIQFSELSKEAEGEFIVLLYDEGSLEYKPFLREHGIEFFQLYEPRYDYTQFRLPNDGHPNAKLTSEWAAKLEPFLKERLVP